VQQKYTHLSVMLCRLEAAAPKAHGESDAIACDPTRPEDCLTYCYVMDDGSMVRSADLQPYISSGDVKALPSLCK
jgi:hypothetical protein